MSLSAQPIHDPEQQGENEDRAKRFQDKLKRFDPLVADGGQNMKANAIVGLAHDGLVP